MYTIIVGLHVIVTILGTGGATIAEFQITKALKDRHVRADEKALLHINYKMIRVGMALLFVSIVAMFWYHLQAGNQFILTSEKLWIKDLMFVMIIVNALALHKRWVPLWLGASVSFTTWWGATLLGLAGRLPYSFEFYLLVYILAILAVAGIFRLLRSWLPR